MWARLDDELIDHCKVFAAGELIGKNGAAVALGFYAVGLMWSNKHLTDGFLSAAVVKNFRHTDDPLRVADALTKVGLFEKVSVGFRIHDFHDYNPSAVAGQKRQKEEPRPNTGERASKNRN